MIGIEDCDEYFWMKMYYTDGGFCEITDATKNLCVSAKEAFKKHCIFHMEFEDTDHSINMKWVKSIEFGKQGEEE